MSGIYFIPSDYKEEWFSQDIKRKFKYRDYDLYRSLSNSWENIYNYAHYDMLNVANRPFCPSDQLQDKNQPYKVKRKTFSSYEEYTPFHFAGLATKLFETEEEREVFGSVSYISEGWKLRFHKENINFNVTGLEMACIQEAIQIVNSKINMANKSIQISNIFPADPVGWTIPVEIKREKPQMDPDPDRVGIGLKDVWGIYEYNGHGNQELKGLYMPNTYPACTYSKIILFVDPINRLAKKIKDDAKKYLESDFSELFSVYSPRWDESFTINMLKSEFDRNDKIARDFYDCWNHYGCCRDYNERIFDKTFLTHIYAYVLAHEFFHAWQDFHIGFSHHSKMRKAGIALSNEAETLAESFAINFVWSVLKDKALAFLLYENRKKEEQQCGKNEYTEVIRRKVLFMDGYKEFFEKLTVWEDDIIDKCYQKSDYENMKDALDTLKKNGVL